MNNRLIFMIYNDEIKFLTNSSMDYKEWYLSLGGDPNQYENIIRGIVIKNQIIFFKANLSYDQEVIDIACKCAPIMKQQLKNPYLKVCCGINPGMNGAEWEPIMTLNDNELTGFDISIKDEIEKKKEEMQKQINQPVEQQSILDFKNNYDDPQFIKLATILTIIILVLTIISKIILHSNKSLDLSNRWNILLVIAQMVLLIGTIIGYSKKSEKTKYLGIAASVALFFMFDLIDIILGIINLLLTIDQGYILNAIDASKNGAKLVQDKGKQLINKK